MPPAVLYNKAQYVFGWLIALLELRHCFVCLVVVHKEMGLNYLNRLVSCDRTVFELAWG